MISQRVPLLIAFSAVLLMLCIALRDWRPSILMIPIASLFLLTNASSPTSCLDVEAKKELVHDSVEVGETSTVKIHLANKGREKIDYLEVFDKIPASLNLLEGTNHLVMSLDPGEVTELTYEVSCNQRGKYEIGPLYLRTRDPLGFNFNESTRPLTNLLHVLPKIYKIRQSDLRFRRTGQWPGIIHSSRRGTGTELYGLRDYVAGDDLRRVEWKASARTGKLMTIEHESELSTDIAIILDASNDSSIGRPPMTPLEYCVGAAGSLASLFLNLGNQVSLISHCEARNWLPGGFGKQHLRSILDHLTGIQAGQTPLPIGFGLPNIFPTKPQVVLVSPLLSPNIAEDIRTLVSEGYSILVISPSLSEILIHENDEAIRTALRILALERRNVIADLRKHSVVVDWNPQDTLSTALKEARRWFIQSGR